MYTTSMQLRERQKSVLDAVVREHIRTARPVASQDIARASFGVGSATIRNEMQELDELGYLEQPHTSAGRVPTDKGYRFFVDYLLADLALGAREQKVIQEVFREQDEEEPFVKELSRAISHMTGAYAAAGSFADEYFYNMGLAEVLAEPEFQEVPHLAAFGRLIDVLDDEIRGMYEEKKISARQVFIGDENPMPEARQYSMVVSSWKHPAGFEGFVTLIGPKRMDYRKCLSLMQFLEEGI